MTLDRVLATEGLANAGSHAVRLVYYEGLEKDNAVGHAIVLWVKELSSNDYYFLSGSCGRSWRELLAKNPSRYKIT